MLSRRQSFLKGAILISLGGFISKLIGAIYRIPLTRFLGSEGMGIYQMVYPLYCILLTVSASGIPTGIARLVSAGGDGAERQALRLYTMIGVIGTILMYLLSSPLAALQGQPAVEICCKMLCPSVFFVSALSVVRGYFQGKGNMYPTAITEVGEQVIKVALGCTLAYMFRDNLTRAVAATLFSVTVSEAAATLFAVVWYLKRRARLPLFKTFPPKLTSVAAYTLPLTFTAIAMPLSQLAESIIAVRFLSGSAINPTSLYGIFSGCAVTIINLPVSITYGLAAASVPQISPLAEKGDMDGAKQKAFKSILITLAVSAPSAVALYIFAPQAINIVFSSLDAQSKSLLLQLVRIMSVNAVTLSLVQTSSACLTSLGSPIKSTVTQWISCILRVGLTAILIKFTSLSIIGAAISANCSYLVATFLNFWYIIIEKRKDRGCNEDNADRIGQLVGRLD